ncbi:uncharacterized protein LOC133910440 [Phragmites australis]|uniref:uncharacterized protein LOC133910440 n=1 Tax=Phragmites australis TaxID=29695 RepID=UPI002D77C9ED|nr:uncharacterized protein LOC133910440 [Phragmites australis]
MEELEGQLRSLSTHASVPERKERRVKRSPSPSAKRIRRLRTRRRRAAGEEDEANVSDIVRGVRRAGARGQARSGTRTTAVAANVSRQASAGKNPCVTRWMPRASESRSNPTKGRSETWRRGGVGGDVAVPRAENCCGWLRRGELKVKCGLSKAGKNREAQRSEVNEEKG